MSMAITARTLQPTPKQIPAGRFYRKELDVLRFFAFLLVFLSHAIPLKDNSSRSWIALKAAGALGVPVFFCLSAYLITELLLRERTQTGSIDLKFFYVRRVLRIWPLYFLILLLGFVFSHWGLRAAMPVPALLSYIFLAGNWYTVFHGYLPHGIDALWSISVEEQFYLFLPGLVKHLTDRNILLGSFFVWGLSQISILALCFCHFGVDPGLWTNTLTNLQYFAIGTAVSAAFNGSVPNFGEPMRCIMIASGLVIFFLATFYFKIVHVYMERSSIECTYPGYLLTGFGTLLILIGFLGSSMLGGSSQLRYLGRISYGLYIYHLPCILLSLQLGRILFKSHISIIGFVVGFPLTVAVSAFSYRYFETPFLRFKERFEIVKSRAV
jgi:peptidoglycan/LPS O-acetylase OafA/YrhL